MRQGGAGGHSGEDQEAAQCGGSQNTGRLLDHQDEQCGRGGRTSWEEKTEGHKVGEKVGQGDGGGDGVREAREENLLEGTY